MVEIADLVAVPDLGLRTVHAATEQPPLRWVATSELLDPTPFLEGGELLLTTGLETEDWQRPQWTPYVARLVASGVAALGVGVELTHARMPPDLVAACRDQGLTLLEIPWETSFVAVSRAAATLLQDEEEAAARVALDHQRRLTQAALGQDPTVLLERLGQVVRGAAAALDREGAVVDGPHGADAGLLDTGLAGEEVRRLRPQGYGALASIAGPRATTVVRPIGIEGRVETYLAVAVPGRARAPEQSAITTAAALLSLAVARRADRRAADRRLRARALDVVLHGDATSAAVLLDVVERPIRLPERLRVLRAAGPPDTVEDAVRGLEDHDVLATVLDDQLVAVLPSGETEQVAERIAELRLRVGVGREVATADAGSSHDTAGLALDGTTPRAAVRRWEDLTDTGPMGLIPGGIARAYASSLLGGLSSDERDTLAAFLRHHGSRGAVADDLGIHRNTVRNRVAAIERQLGASLDDPAARVAAWIALHAPVDQR